MADRSKVYEITVTALGVLVTAILGYGQYRMAHDQSQMAARQLEAENRRAVDAVEVQMLNLVAPYLPHLAQPGPETHKSQKVVLAASEYLSSQYGRTALATMATKITEGSTKVSPEIKTRLKEATIASAPAAKWFVVLATLPNNEGEAKSKANGWLKRISENLPGVSVSLYKTKVSNDYAIVLGEPASKNVVADLVQQVRRHGLTADTFAQQDRDWTRVGKAPFPAASHTLRIERTSMTESATLGKLYMDGEFIGHTLEQPKTGTGNLSAIPAGTYPVKVVFSPRFKRPMIQLFDVPNRQALKIQPGNTVSHIEGGGIAVGREITAGSETLAGSAETFSKLMSKFSPDDVGALEIIESR